MDLKGGDVLNGDDLLDERAGEDHGEWVPQRLQQLQHHQVAAPASATCPMHYHVTKVYILRINVKH